MLARKKSKQSLQPSVTGDDRSSSGSSFPNLGSGNIMAKSKGISPSSSSSTSLLSHGYSIKREDVKKEGVKRRAPSIGVGRGRRSDEVTGGVTLQQQQNDLLDAMIPGMKGLLFAPEVNNLQKAKELKKLLNCLGDWGSINDQVMLKLIDNLKQNVEGLDERMTLLVAQTLDANWCSRSPKVVKAFEEFISELLIIRPCYAGTVLQSLIRKFLPQTLEDQNPDQIYPEDQKMFEVAHCNLARLLEAFPIPRMKDSCVKTMGAQYPYMGRSAHVHFCFVKNLIRTISYAPQITCQILHLCIHKLCRIDVNVPRDDSEEFSETISESILTEERIKSENGGGHISVKLDSRQIINSIISGSNAKLNPLVNILDLCLSLVFECVETIVGNSTSSDEDDYLANFYDALLSTFETEILPTFGVNHVQFLYFYLVSTQPVFTRKFLEFLWKKATNVNTPAVIRMQCMSYISGVLTRSSVVSVKILKRWLSTMADWANIYVDQRVKSSHWSSVNVQTHGPFYAVCQTIFYVFAFRNKDLVGSRKCTAFTGTLNLGRLVTCDLNPLKAVIPPVAVAFVKAAHVHQISYCQTVLERNQRATIPTSVRDSLSVSAMDSIGPDSNVLESFFPFDPFLLPRSKKWVDPTYKIYEQYLPQMKIEKSDESPARQDRFSDENDDSIDMELSSSFKDKDCSHFMARLMNSSDVRDELDDPMDDS